MIKYRITKYNPKDRNEFGYYDSDYDDWTSFDDIGKDFKGKKLTLEEYLRYEDKYINYLTNVLSYLKIKNLCISNIYNHLNYFSNNHGIKLEKFNILSNLKEDSNISLELIDVIVRVNLRLVFSCIIFCENFYLVFGEDFYMYIFSKNEIQLDQIKVDNIYLEKLGKVDIDKSERSIVASLKNSEYLLDELELNINLISLNNIRNILCLSENNPLGGLYKINEEISKYLNKFYEYKFYFDEYDYYISTENLLGMEVR